MEEDDDSVEDAGGSEEEAEEQEEPADGTKPAPRRHALTAEELAQMERKTMQRGVMYIAKVPPNMRPDHMKHLLSVHAKVERIYLVPEDPEVREHRIKQGGNRKVRYREGWVEFADKKVARELAARLHASPMLGGQKKGAFAADLWALRYLPRFKWHHLMEKLSFEKRIRKERLRTELAQAKRDNEAFLQRVDQSHKLDSAEARKTKEAVERGELRPDAAAGGARSEDVLRERSKVRRKFKQLPALGTTHSEDVEESARKLGSLLAGSKRSRDDRK